MARELDAGELETLDLRDKYDDDLFPYASLSWKDFALLYAALASLLVFIGWACLATVDELTRGEGRVVPSSEVQVVQNLEGGIIDAFYVDEGQEVKEGQILLRMRNIQFDGEYQAILQRFHAASAALARLEAQAGGGDAPVFPDGLESAAPQAVQLELAAWHADRRQYDSQTDILRRQHEQRKQEAQETAERIAGAGRVLEFIRKEYGIVAPLLERGTVSKIEVLDLERKIAAQEAELKNLAASRARAEAAMQEAEEKIAEHAHASRAEAQQQIAGISVEKGALQESLAAYKDRATRTELRAPVHGTVKDIKIKTVGGVARPGEPIMEIVPLNDQLIVEARVSPSQIAFLRPGLPAKVKLTAYDYTVYGAIDARVTDISADTLENERGESFYRVKLQSEETALTHEGEALPILPGMVASVDILTGKKTVMSYLIGPVSKTVGGALHER